MRKKSEKIYVPYHVNPAVIKGYLMQLPKDQLILHGRYIRLCAWHSELGSTKRAMFIGLYRFCRLLYAKKYK